jgi:hypothetical protein
MGRNEIRLRKKIISPDNIDQHRDYSRLMKKHNRYLKMRGLMRFLIYFTIATILLVLILVAMWRVKLEQHKKSLEEKFKTSLIIKEKTDLQI